MAKKKQMKKPYQGWNLLEHGVTQSMLSRFFIDEERFYIRNVKCLKETNRKEAMDYGTIFHKLIELHAKLGKRFHKARVAAYMQKWVMARFGEEAVLLAKIAIAEFEEYRLWESTLPVWEYVDQEVKFQENFTLPPITFSSDEGNISVRVPKGIVIPLRGRIDELIMIDGKLWLQENKTKSRIDINSIINTIHRNIQVMFYATCIELKYGMPCAGVIYNVIRKPGQVQRTGRKNKTGIYVGGESDLQYVNRIVSEIRQDPKHYFTRLQYQFPDGAVHEWQRRTLIPYLYKIYLWWRSWEKNPTNPWEDAQGNINPFHAERPFGIYDPFSNGVGEYFNYLTTGSTLGLEKNTEFFPELQDENDEELDRLVG